MREKWAFESTPGTGLTNRVEVKLIQRMVIRVQLVVALFPQVVLQLEVVVKGLEAPQAAVGPDFILFFICWGRKERKWAPFKIHHILGERTFKRDSNTVMWTRLSGMPRRKPCTWCKCWMISRQRCETMMGHFLSLKVPTTHIDEVKRRRMRRLAEKTQHGRIIHVLSPAQLAVQRLILQGVPRGALCQTRHRQHYNDRKARTKHARLSLARSCSSSADMPPRR